MVRADKLIKEQKIRENIKNETFEKILLKVEKKIVISSNANYYFTWYSIPEFIVGLPLYSINDCKDYLETKLSKNGFEIEFFLPNILLIKWFPVNKKSEKKKI